MVLTTHKVLKCTMKNNLVWKKFEIFWPKILHFKRIKMSETHCTWRSKILCLEKEHFLSLKKINVTYLRKQYLEFWKASFSSLHTINKPCLLKQVKIAKVRWQLFLNSKLFEAVWLWIWGRIVSQQTILIFQIKKKVEFSQQCAFFLTWDFW